MSFRRPPVVAPMYRLIGPFLLVLLLSARPVAAQARVPGEDWMAYETPEEAGWASERLDAASAFADTIGSAAFMLVYDGAVVATHGDVARRYMNHSIRKSLLSALYGIYVEDGTIDLDASLADLGIDDIGSLDDAEKRATVLDLLQAQSGVYHPAAYESPAMAASRPARGSHEPGTFWYYNNWDFNALGTIFREQTGEDLFEAFGARLAEPIGMRDYRPRDGYYHLQAEVSRHAAYPIRMSTRDLARFGLLFARDGNWAGRQVVPDVWVARSVQSYSRVADDPGMSGYGYMWWLLDEPLSGGYAALGAGGHAVVVLPEHDVVFVHRVDTYQGYRVGSQQLLDLLHRLLRARVGEAAEAPRLVPLEAETFRVAEAPVPASVLRRYARSYTFPDGRTVEVFLDGGELFMHADGDGTFELFPVSTTEFLVEDTRVPVFFEASGDSVRLVHEGYLSGATRQLLAAGRADAAEALARRLVDYYPESWRAHHGLGEARLAAGDTARAVAPFRAAVELNPDDVRATWLLIRVGAPGFEATELSPERMGRYVGVYEFNGIVSEVTLEGDGLRFQASERQAPIPMVAASDDTFYAYLEPFRLVFRVRFVPADGTVTAYRVRTSDGFEAVFERSG